MFDLVPGHKEIVKWLLWLLCLRVARWRNWNTDTRVDNVFVARMQHFVVFGQIWCCSSEKPYDNIATFSNVCINSYLR